MNKLIVTLIAGLFASAAFAQAPATVAPAKSAQSDVKAVKTTPHHTTAKTKTHHATHHVTAKKKAPPVQAKADTKAIAPK